MTSLPPASDRPWRTTAEVLLEFGLSDRMLCRLIAEGRVGHLNTRPHRFMPEHREQIRDAIEVKPRTEIAAVTIPGASRRSVAARRTA